MKPSSILMSSFAALLIMISVRENSLNNSIEFSKPNEAVASVLPIAAILKTPSNANHISKSVTDFEYLKFSVSDFETTGTSNEELPVEANFDYLKFNVSDFIETETEIGILPEDSDFDYLKFDVTNYTSSSCDEELPLTDFSYLKFDVQKFIQNDTVLEINELPE